MRNETVLWVGYFLGLSKERKRKLTVAETKVLGMAIEFIMNE